MSVSIKRNKNPGLLGNNRKKRAAGARKSNPRANGLAGVFSRPLGGQQMMFVKRPIHDRGMQETMAGSLGKHIERIGSLPDEVQRVIRSFALPADSDPERIATIYSSGATAVAAPWKTADLKMYTAAPDNPNYPATAHLPGPAGFFFQFRDAVRHTVRYDSTISAAGYRMQFASSAGPTNTRSLAFDLSGPILVLWATAYSGYVLYGPILYPGYFSRVDGSGLRYFWLDSVGGATQINCTFDAPALGVTLDLYVERWEETGVEHAAAQEGITTPSVSHQFVISASGYYALKYRMTGANSNLTNFGVTFDFSATDYFAHQSIPGLEANFLSVEGVIVTSAAHTITNKSAIISKQGQIVQCQVPQGTDWRALVSTVNGGSPFNNIARFNGSTKRTAELGCYSWMKPTQPTDFMFVSQPSSDAGFIQSCMFSLDTPSSFLAIGINITAQLGRDLYVTECAHINYQTQDVWRVLSEPDVTRQSYEMAMDHLKYMSQFFENENHFAKLFGDIKKFVRTAVPYVEKALPYIAKYGPMAVKALSSL